MHLERLHPALLLLGITLLGLAACGSDPLGASDAASGDVGGFDAGARPSLDASAPDAFLEGPDATTAPGADAQWPDAGLEPGLDASSAADADAPDAEPAPAPDAGLLDAGAAGRDAAVSAPDGGRADSGAASFFPVRVMAANLTSGTLQSYDSGEGLRLIQGVSPDVVLIQEFRYGDNLEATMQSMVDATLGSGFSWCREYASPPPAGTIPNGIISRWPILECGSWDDTTMFGSRDFAYARIDLPGPRDLWAVSVHLRTNDAATRDAEAKALVGYLSSRVPQDAFLVVGGDFNTNAMSEYCYATLSAAVDVAAPHPADQKGNIYTNRKRQLPFDHVFADPGLRALQVPTVVGNSVYAAGLVLDSRVYTPLYEIDPVLVGDSAALNMQHMGVVKDFQVPY
ncbi:MAG TPA: endonuclease/exonuclease/phosphatase family protein [Myxococcales bacterium]|jgi:endonuclease/exonuclease/phosphatase family metal-dependent hydrolase